MIIDLTNLANEQPALYKIEQREFQKNTTIKVPEKYGLIIVQNGEVIAKVSGQQEYVLNKQIPGVKFPLFKNLQCDIFVVATYVKGYDLSEEDWVKQYKHRITVNTGFFYEYTLPIENFDKFLRFCLAGGKPIAELYGRVCLKDDIIAHIKNLICLYFDDHTDWIDNDMIRAALDNGGEDSDAFEAKKHVIDEFIAKELLDNLGIQYESDGIALDKIEIN